MDILSNFGENLNELIFDRQITPLTFSESTKIDPSIVYKYLRKEILPTLPKLITVCDYFQCSVDFILGFTPENPKTNYRTAPPFSKRFQTLLRENNMTRYRFMKISRAKKFSFARQSVDDWFHGKRQPNIDNLVAIAKFFDCSLDYLLDRE